MFARSGGVTIDAVAPFKSASRDGAARLMRDARRERDCGRAVALRGAWREMLAICMDGGLSVEDAEVVAAGDSAKEGLQ